MLLCVMTGGFGKVDNAIAAATEGFLDAGMQAFMAIVKHADQHRQVDASDADEEQAIAALQALVNDYFGEGE